MRPPPSLPLFSLSFIYTKYTHTFTTSKLHQNFQFTFFLSSSSKIIPKKETKKMKKMSEEEDQVPPSTLFLSQISQFCSLIFSHPLYFSYIIFFSPYILKLLSFLSPLFTTTFLLLAFFTFSNNSDQNYQDDDDQSPLDDEWLNSLFSNTPPEIPITQSPLEDVLDQEPEIKKEIVNNNDHVNKLEEPKDEDHDRDHISSKDQAKMGMDDKSFLECKLVVEDEDKMDLLWEKYEDKELVVMEKLLVVEEEENKKKSCNLKKDLRSLVIHQKEMEEEEDEEEEGKYGKICCLQALKFSSGKMRFGMGKKSGLKKISKAFKGLKFLHQLANNGKNKTHS